jgi:hypothetical protein
LKTIPANLDWCVGRRAIIISFSGEFNNGLN